MSETTSVRLHKSVLVNEVLEYLDPKPGKVFLDVTFGTGGHTRMLLESDPTCTVIAMDWDERALEVYGQPLVEEFGDRLRLVWGNFSLLYKIAKRENIPKVDGILADFGTSQIHIFERPGFSFKIDTPLDMRMSPPHQKTTAEHVLNKATEKSLADIFWHLGQERHARKVAHAIVQERFKKKFKTTRDLAQLVERIVPASVNRKIHPATRVFQALRIYVNKELDNISAFLPMSLSMLKPGGWLVCISFHSLEDRLVKDFFKERAGLNQIKILTPKVVMATPEEAQENPSSRSARLRAAQLL